MQMKPDNTRKISGTLQPQGGSQRPTYWIAALELLLMFALADVAVIARSFGLVTDAQLLAWALTYMLIALGTLFTVYAMSRSRSGR
jgi:uncharacterized membrane protein YhaH (DUF805 family)